MLYELSHFVKEHMGFLWSAVEWGNAEVFALMHRKGLRGVPAILDACSTDEFCVRQTRMEDVDGLVKFFAEQPEEVYTFFNPHGFDAQSVRKVLRNKSFMTYVVTEGETIVGYFFLRSFVNGKCFKGRMVDYRWRNRGIAKLMGKAINETAMHLGMRIYTTISPQNYASLASTKAVNDIKIIKTLENGYYYIECTPKRENLGGGELAVNQRFTLYNKRRWSYAA